LYYIENIACECLPPKIDGEWMDVDDGLDPDEGVVTNTSADQIFRPFPDPDNPDFEAIMERDVYHIVLARQIHARKHKPTCFKYGSTKCRLRFPRKLISETSFDEQTGIIYVKRTHSYVNNYNKWFSITTRGNHDIQFLFTKKHTLAIINYIMKYITKPEASLHSKLTVAAAVRKTMSEKPEPNSSADIARLMLLKTYNKLDSLREVGVPEAISHLLKFPDHYTDANFVNIHTNHLLRHMQLLVQLQDSNRDKSDEEDEFSSEIIATKRGYTTVSLFDDYAYRGESLTNYCLYDYCSQFYKVKRLNGLPFNSPHPQYDTYSQFLRHNSPTVPTLLGKALFVKPDCSETKKVADYYCLMASLFFPWHNKQPPKSCTESWEEFVLANQDDLCPRLKRYIYNLGLLHQSVEDTKVHQMQLRAQQDSPARDAYDFDDNSFIQSNDLADFYDSDVDDDVFPDLQKIVGDPNDMNLDFDAREGLDAFRDITFPDITTQSYSSDPQQFQSLYLPLKTLKSQMLLLTDQVKAHQLNASLEGIQVNSDNIVPDVFITDGTNNEPAILHIVSKFTLNTEQERGFRIVAYHTLNGSHVGPQLRLGVFGEGGTGKSQLIKAIQEWFRMRHRSEELVVTATTGTAAFNIKGVTVHSAANLPIGKGKRTIGVNKEKLWAQRRYLIEDEVSMMDRQMIMNLHTNLNNTKAFHNEYFGGVNVIFMGDFYQMPTISGEDLYIDELESPTYQGHHLWRSLNACVILTEQMRQADDPEFAAMLQRIRIHQPTDDDIETLNSRVGAHISPRDPEIRIVVRRHKLREALNAEKLRQVSEMSGAHIIHCLAEIKNRSKMTLSEVYALKGGRTNFKSDGILSVIAGAPLVITENINVPLGKFFYTHLICITGLVNGAIVEFYGFADKHGVLIKEEVIMTLPAYMLVKLKNDVGIDVHLPGLPPFVVGIEPSSSTYYGGHGKNTTISQFPAVLGYAITDFKCQSQTFSCHVIVDLKRPTGRGRSPGSSPYVQLSRIKSLSRLSILRPFDPQDLRSPLPKELQAELKWQEQLAERTKKLYI